MTDTDNLADRITLQPRDVGHGLIYEIFIDGEPAGHSMRFSGQPSDADMRRYAAKRLRDIGLAE